MRLIRPPADKAPFGLRALKMVAMASEAHSITPAVQNMLSGAQHVLLGTDIDIETLRPIEPGDLARALWTQDDDKALPTQLVQGMLMVSLADGPPTREQMDLIDRFAAALGVKGPELESMRLLAAEHMMFFRLHFFRHSHLGRLAGQGVVEDGLLRPVRDFLMLRGLAEDPELAARYHALASLPEGTLGRELLAYFERNHFTPPGEKGGFPELGIWHDIGHVLTGYGTDAEGELELAAFQAGYMKNNPMFMLLFAALTFSAGINVTPIPQPHVHSLFAKPGLAERVFAAIERGANVKVDLSDHWDHWPWFDKPIDEVRRELGISPPSAAPKPA